MTNLSLGQIAAAAKLRASAIRYYESEGLLPPAYPQVGEAALRSGDSGSSRADRARLAMWLLSGGSPHVTAWLRARHLAGKAMAPSVEVEACRTERNNRADPANEAGADLHQPM